MQTAATSPEMVSTTSPTQAPIRAEIPQLKDEADTSDVRSTYNHNISPLTSPPVDSQPSRGKYKRNGKRIEPYVVFPLVRNRDSACPSHIIYI